MKRGPGCVNVMIGVIGHPKIQVHFTCKHIDSCYFLLAELKGVGKQATLEVVDKKVIA